MTNHSLKYCKPPLLLAANMLCSCVLVVPKKVTSYDSACKLTTKHIELSIEEVETYGHMGCANDDCLDNLGDLLAYSTLTAATSTIVSGSIALVGNTLYWLERQGNCPADNQTQESLPAKIEGVETISEEIISAKS